MFYQEVACYHQQLLLPFYMLALLLLKLMQLSMGLLFQSYQMLLNNQLPKHCLTYFQRKRQRLLKVTSTRSLTNYLLKQTYHDSIPAKSIVGVVIYN